MYYILLCFICQSLSGDTVISIDTTSYNQESHPVKNMHETKNRDAVDTIQTTNPINTLQLATNKSDDQNIIMEYHDIELKNEFSSVVNSYLDDFENMKIDNCKNIEKFAGNVVVVISFNNINEEDINNLAYVINELFITENNTNIKMMYHATKNKKQDTTFCHMHDYYRAKYQQFQYHFINDQIAKNKSETYDIVNNTETFNFADKYDASCFTKFFSNNDIFFSHKNLIIDNCCKTKHEYHFLSKLLNCCLLYLDQIKSTFIFSIKNNNSDRETLIQKITDIFNEKLSFIKDEDCDVYISKIHVEKDLHKIKVNKLEQDKKENRLKIIDMPCYVKKPQFDSIYTLWPYSIFADIKFYTNGLIKNGFINQDSKLFKSDNITDINNLTITISDWSCIYKYMFFRTIEFCENNRVILKYFGVTNERVTRDEKFMVYMCATYEYIKEDMIFKCYKQTNVNQIPKFFEKIKTVCMKNANEGCNYFLDKSNPIKINLRPFIFTFIELQFNSLHNKLNTIFNKLENLKCEIQIMDDRQKYYDFELSTPILNTYEVNPNIFERICMSETWTRIVKDKLPDLINNLFYKLFFKISHEEYGYKSKFYLRVVNMIPNMEYNPVDDIELIENLNEKCIVYINSFDKTFKSKKLDGHELLDDCFNFEEFIKFCFSENDNLLPISILVRPCLRKKFIEHKLGIYFSYKFC